MPDPRNNLSPRRKQKRVIDHDGQNASLGKEYLEASIKEIYGRRIISRVSSANRKYTPIVFGYFLPRTSSILYNIYSVGIVYLFSIKQKLLLP